MSDLGVSVDSYYKNLFTLLKMLMRWKLGKNLQNMCLGKKWLS